MLLDEYLLLVIETRFCNDLEEKLQEVLDSHLKMGAASSPARLYRSTFNPLTHKFKKYIPPTLLKRNV